MSTIPSPEDLRGLHELALEKLDQETERLRTRVHSALTATTKRPVVVAVSRYGFSAAVTDRVALECVDAGWQVRVSERYIELTDRPTPRKA